LDVRAVPWTDAVAENIRRIAGKNTNGSRVLRTLVLSAGIRVAGSNEYIAVPKSELTRELRVGHRDEDAALQEIVLIINKKLKDYACTIKQVPGVGYFLASTMEV
jgi:hypothetical protein